MTLLALIAHWAKSRQYWRLYHLAGNTKNMLIEMRRRR